MKKVILILTLICIETAVLGQGVVQFRNYYPPAQIDAPIRYYSMTGFLLDSSNTAWRAALIGGPAGSTAASELTPGTLQMMYNPTNTNLTWVNFRSGTIPPAAAGYVNVGTRPERVVPGVDWGGTAVVQMVVWEGPYEDWVSAWNASQSPGSTCLVGWSNPLTITLPTSPTGNPAYLVGLNPFFIGADEYPGRAMIWSPRIDKGQLQFDIVAQPARSVIIEYAASCDADAASWTPLTNFVATGRLQLVTDPSGTGDVSQRFYRVRMPQ